MHLLDVLQAFSADVPAFLASSIVSREEGTALASITANPRVEVMGADAWLAELLVRHDATLAALRVEDTTEDLFITTQRALLIARPLPGTPWFWHVVTSAQTSLGLTRAIMRKFEPELMQRLP